MTVYTRTNHTTPRFVEPMSLIQSCFSAAQRSGVREPEHLLPLRPAGRPEAGGGGGRADRLDPAHLPQLYAPSHHRAPGELLHSVHRHHRESVWRHLCVHQPARGHPVRGVSAPVPIC